MVLLLTRPSWRRYCSVQASWAILSGRPNLIQLDQVPKVTLLAKYCSKKRRLGDLDRHRKGAYEKWTPQAVARSRTDLYLRGNHARLRAYRAATTYWAGSGWGTNTRSPRLIRVKSFFHIAMSNGTLEPPLSTSLVRTLAKSSTLQHDPEKTGFGNSYVRINQFIFVQWSWSVFFPIQDGDSPTHTLIGSRQPSDTDVSLAHNNSN